MIEINGLNFSPFFWWKTIERAVEFSDFMGKSLIDGFSFRDWLKNEILEHSSVDIYDESESGQIMTTDYRKATTNDYFFEVYTTNIYGHKVTDKTIEGLKKKHDINEDSEIWYRFKVDELNHFATLHLQKWLAFENHYDWIRWHLYYDFVSSKLSEYKKGLYTYCWSIIFKEVEFQTNFFNSVEQYKQLRDKSDQLMEQSNYIEHDAREKNFPENNVKKGK
jgi:hypothetical protein